MPVGHFMSELIARLQRVSHFPQRVFFRIYDWRRRDAWEDALSANLFKDVSNDLEVVERLLTSTAATGMELSAFKPALERPRFESFALISSPEGLV